MKKTIFAAVMIFAMLAFGVGYVSSAENSPKQQDQKEKKKDKNKDKNKGENKDEPAQKTSGELGTKTNPVRCEGPSGERQYLSRLRCSDGSRPAFSRIGSFGFGPYGNIIDGYRVKCEQSDEVTIFMDMYHEGYVEKQAVPGFTIVD